MRKVLVIETKDLNAEQKLDILEVLKDKGINYGGEYKDLNLLMHIRVVEENKRAFLWYQETFVGSIAGVSKDELHRTYYVYNYLTGNIENIIYGRNDNVL